MISLFQELSDEITILKIRIKDLEIEHKRLRKMMWANFPKGISAVDYSAERVTSNSSPYPLDEILRRMEEISIKIQPLYDMVEGKEKTIKEMRQAIDEMDGLERKVAFMHMVEGIPLNDIAIELNYSYQYIKELNSKANKSVFTYQEPTKGLL